MPFVNKARRVDPNLRKTNIGLTKREKEIYTIYSNAFKGVRNQLGDQKVLRDIMDALKANSASGVNNAINWRTFLESLNRTAPALAAQMVEVANLHSKVLPKKVQYQYNFESKDPRAIAWAQTQAGKRIQGITLETQQAVSDLIADGLRTKLSRDEIVAQLRQSVGLDRRQSKALGNFYMKRLEKYLEDGLTYEEAAAKAEKNGVRYRDKLLRQRAIRIARTEISAAANAGRYLSWEEANARGLLPPDSKKRWLTNIDERTCPICQPMNGTLIPWQATFSTGDIMPPAHPNCRCTSVIVPGEIQVIKSVEKHLQGKHDQSSHAGGRKGKVSISPTTNGSRKVSLGMYSADYAVGDLEATAQDGKDFMYRWEKNYEMRTVSAHLMGLEGVKSAGREKDNLEHDYLDSLVNPFGDDPEEFVYPKPILEAIVGSSRLMDATHKTAPSEVNLFRGIKAERGSPLRNMREGQTFELPLSSFAQKAYYAEGFAGTSGERPNVRGTSIIFNLKGLAKTYVLDPEESLAQGRFKINKIDKVANAAGSTTQVIELVQEATFDLETGTYVPVK